MRPVVVLETLNLAQYVTPHNMKYYFALLYDMILYYIILRHIILYEILL